MGAAVRLGKELKLVGKAYRKTKVEIVFTGRGFTIIVGIRINFEIKIANKFIG